jgi:hypothetical protein
LAHDHEAEGNTLKKVEEHEHRKYDVTCIKNMMHKSASNVEEVSEEAGQYCKCMGHISWLDKY